jgi:hypothetical protein
MGAMPHDSRPDASAPRDDAGRKPYRPPVLTEYGSISKLTRTGGSTRSEGATPVMRMK